MVEVGFSCTGPEDQDFHLLAPVFLSAGIRLIPVSLARWRPELHEFRSLIMKGGVGRESGSSVFSEVPLSTWSASRTFFNNPLSVIGWAENKENFFAFHEKGVSTQMVRKFGSRSELIDFFEFSNGQHFLLGGNGEHQYVDLRTEEQKNDAIQKILTKNKTTTKFFLKENIESVLELGWVSFYFFGGRISHATKTQLVQDGPQGIMKKKVSSVSPNEAMVEAAAYTASVSDDLFAEGDIGYSMSEVLYSRFDFIADSIRPTLYDWSFFDTDFHISLHPQAATRILRAFLLGL